MAIIYSYPKELNILSSDIVIGTSTKQVAGKAKNQTRSFAMGDIAGFVVNTIPRGTLTTSDDVNITLTLDGFPINSLFNDVSVSVGWVGSLADNRIASSSYWNAKQQPLIGNGIVKSSNGIISYLTDNSSEWDLAYDGKINSAAVTGTNTKTLTLTKQDGGTITASWQDSGGLSGIGFVKVNGTTVSYDNSTYVPTSRTITINGVTQDLSSNRSWTVNGAAVWGDITGNISSQTDLQNALNDKQNKINGTGIVYSSNGMISYLTNNSDNWNTAYNSKINTASVTGTITKTLTLTQQDGNTITANWTDEAGNLSLTTYGSNGPATLVDNILNVPNYGTGSVNSVTSGDSNQIDVDNSDPQNPVLYANVAPVSTGSVNLVTGGEVESYIGGLDLVYSVNGNNSAFINTTNTGTTNNPIITASLSAIGTADSTTYLRGDNTWATLDSSYVWYLGGNIGTEPNIVPSGAVVNLYGGDMITTDHSGGNSDFLINHDSVIRTDTTSSVSPAFGSAFTVIDSVTSTSTGHISAINLKTVTLPTPPPTPASDVQNAVKAGVAINKGQAVYVTGADGTNIIVGLASYVSEATSSKTLGLLDATVAANGFANVVQIGRLAGLNIQGAVSEGDPVWLGPDGNLIYGLTNKPYAPLHLVFIGIVTRVNANNGEIFVNVQNGFELNEIHDVDIKTNVPINGDVLGYDGTLWVNKTIAGWLGYTPANDANVVHKTGAETITGTKTFNNNVAAIGIDSNNNDAGIGIRSNNAYLGDGIQSNNNGDGTGISSRNNAAGTGIYAGNSSTGRAISVGNGSTGTGIYLDNTSSGSGLILNNSADATGTPFAIKKNNVDKLTINDNGEVTGNKFIKIGGTATQFLKADGSVDSNEYVTLSTSQAITGYKTFTNNDNTQIAFTNTSVNPGLSGKIGFSDYFNFYSGTGFKFNADYPAGVTSSTPVVLIEPNGQLILKKYVSATAFYGMPVGVLAFDSAGNIITTQAGIEALTSSLNTIEITNTSVTQPNSKNVEMRKYDFFAETPFNVLVEYPRTQPGKKTYAYKWAPDNSYDYPQFHFAYDFSTTPVTPSQYYSQRFLMEATIERRTFGGIIPCSVQVDSKSDLKVLFDPLYGLYPQSAVNETGPIGWYLENPNANEVVIYQNSASSGNVSAGITYVYTWTVEDMHNIYLTAVTIGSWD